MAENSIFWDTNVAVGDGSASYTMDEIVENWLRYTMLRGAETSEGVLAGILNQLAVTGTSSPVQVDTGAAYVYGFPYFNTTAVNVTVPTPTTNTRIDTIVLRASWSAQTVRIARVAGVEGAGVPTLTQNGGTTWELPLADVSITTGGVIMVTDRRGYAHFATNVNSAMLDNKAVTTAKIADGAVDSLQILTAAITAAKIAVGAVGTDELGTDAVTNAKVANDAINTAEIVNAAVTLAKMASGSVGTAQIVDAAVTLAKLASNSVDASKIIDGAVGTLELATDAVTAAKIAAGAVGTSEIAAGAVGTSQLAADSVDDTKAGNRVPQFYRRQGGHATDWATPGTTNYTPTAVRIQAGVKSASFSNDTNVFLSVQFPVSFSGHPVVVAMARDKTTKTFLVARISHDATSVQFNVWEKDNTLHTGDVEVYWIAIGPE